MTREDAPHGFWMLIFPVPKVWIWVEGELVPIPLHRNPS